MKSRFLLALSLALSLALPLALVLPVPAGSADATTAGVMWMAASVRLSRRNNSTEEMRTGTELHCALEAQKRHWCSLYCLEGHLCRLYNSTFPASRQRNNAPDVACKSSTAEVVCEEPFAVLPEMADLGCLYLETLLLSWDAARNNCKALGGDLFVPADGEQFISLGYHYDMHMEEGAKWVGMVLHEWTDGRPENEVWAPGEPNYSGDCGIILDSELLDRPCKHEYRSICQK